jgi:broad specificity phosphatase PhoE
MSFVSSTNCQPQNGDGAYTDAAANNNNDVFMTRHSARVDREGNGIYTWDPLPGHSRDDAHLSEGGLQASQELAKRFDDISISHIVSSPFVRCIQTVAPIAKAKGIPIKVEPGICEVLNAQYPPGFWSAGQLAKAGFPIHVDYEPVMTKSQLRREQGDWEAARRSTRVATTIRNTLDGPILFCGHGASCLGIAEAFGDSGYVGYSSFSHCVLTSAGKNKWQVKASGDVSHLSRELRKQSLESAW